MDRTTKIILGLIIAVLVVWGGYNAFKNASTSTGLVKIGVMSPFTGDAATYGESVKKGVELAKKDLGLSNVQLIYEDTKCDPKLAVDAANKLVSVDGVVAIVGELCSSATRAAAPIVNQGKVVLISPASTNPDITNDGDYIFRTVPSDSLQGAFGAKFVYDKGYKKLAVLYSNEDYGIGFNKVLNENFPKLGGTVVASEAINRDAVDARTQLAKIKSANPDALYIIHNGPTAVAGILRQIKELGLKVFIVGSEGLKGDEVLKGAGVAAEGLYVTSVSSGTTDFQSRHMAEYKVAPGPFAAQAYDAFKAIAQAMAGGAKTGEEIKDALYKVDFAGASGHIKFDSNGDVAGNYDVFTVKNGKFELVK